jgi:hypothetical protein
MSFRARKHSGSLDQWSRLYSTCLLLSTMLSPTFPEQRSSTGRTEIVANIFSFRSSDIQYKIKGSVCFKEKHKQSCRLAVVFRASDWATHQFYILNEPTNLDAGGGHVNFFCHSIYTVLSSQPLILRFYKWVPKVFKNQPVV